MFIRAIPFLFSAVLLYIHIKKNKLNLSPGLICLFFYNLCFFLSIVLYFFEDPPYPSNNIVAMLYMGACFFMLLYPCTNMIASKNCHTISPIDNDYTIYPIYTFAILGTLSTAYFFTQGYNNLLSFSSLGENRGIIASEGTSEASFMSTIMTQLAVILFPACIFFCFYYLTQKKINYILLLLLIIGGWAESFHILCFLGRDGFVQYIIYIILCYAFFRRYINPNHQKIIITFKIAAVVFLLFFLMISISRAIYDGSDSYFGFYNYIVDYLGQMPRYFNSAFETTEMRYRGIAANTNPLRKLFSYYSEAKYSMRYYSDIELIEYYKKVYGHHPNVFSSFLTSYISDYGKCGTLIIVFLFSYFINKTVLFFRKDPSSLSYSLVIISYTFFLMLSIFYNRLMLAPSDFFRLLFYIYLCLALRFWEKQSIKINFTSYEKTVTN